MAWVADPGTIVAGTPAVDGRLGSHCPSGWEEDWDRAQMSTEVLIGHQLPGDVPTFSYNLPGTFANPPAAGAITFNDIQQQATTMRISKFEIGGLSHNVEVWMRYVQKDSTVSITAVNRSVADDNNKRRAYRVTGTPVEQAGHFDVPVFWTDGTEGINSGEVELNLQLVAEPPQLWQDAYGIAHYGHLTFTRTDLIRVDPMSNPIYQTLADRILEIRGSNSVPHLEAVTIDARTGPDWYPIHNMELMSAAAPEKPSRYLACLKVDGRLIFHRTMFATSVRHFIARDEWTTRITLDVAEWAGTL